MAGLIQKHVPAITLAVRDVNRAQSVLALAEELKKFIGQSKKSAVLIQPDAFDKAETADDTRAAMEQNILHLTSISVCRPHVFAFHLCSCAVRVLRALYAWRACCFASEACFAACSACVSDLSPDSS